MFSRYGIPDVIISDNGPHFSSSEFKDFVSSYQITHTTTSPYHAQANGQTERMVQTVKRIITKSKDPYLALLEYRNTKIMSPAQLFLGRRLKSIVPTALIYHERQRCDEVEAKTTKTARKF
jgi:transposase InsO family protein